MLTDILKSYNKDARNSLIMPSNEHKYRDISSTIHRATLKILAVRTVIDTPKPSICSCSSSFGLRSAVQHEAMAYGMLPCRPAAAAATAVDMSVMYRLQRRIFECRVHALFCANIK